MGNSIHGTRSLNVGRFTPRLDDIYIVTYPRSGTTWLQMILYQLTTDGNMTFTHISQYIPFLERAMDQGRDMDRRASPRIFKTHWQLGKIRRWPGRYIYVRRDGKDVAVSYFHFYRKYFGFDKTFAAFFEMFLAGSVPYGSWFQHVKDAQKYISFPDVLFLDYESLVENLDESVKSIACFCDLRISDNKRATAVERSRFDFMREHETKFDHATEVLWEKTQDISRGDFLRRGKVGDWINQLTNEQRSAFEAIASNLGD